MTRPVLAALFLLWTAGPVLAQEAEPKPAATQQDPEAAYQDLARALNKAISEWRKEAMAAVKAAQAEGREIPAIAMRPPTKAFIQKAMQFADEYAGTDDAVPFLAFVIKNASDESDSVRQAVKTLWADHSSSGAITPVLGHVGNAAAQHEAAKEVASLLDTVIADNADADAKATALLVRGSMRLEQAEDAAQRKVAIDDIRKVSTLTKNEELLAQARSALFEIEHLQVGCVAPDIAAKDTDGVDFKLSDYRGKVVLLDFWGFW